MSYEDALKAMRAREVEPAPLQRLQEKQEARGEVLPPRVASVATGATVVAALAFFAIVVRPTFAYGDVLGDGLRQLHLPALLPATIMLWSLRRIAEHRLGAQLICRAVWWSNLVVGVLISLNYGSTLDKTMGAAIAIACAIALRFSGERGLDIEEPDHPFAPVRFRGHLLLALVMAAADALTLAFSGLLQLRFGADGWNVLGTLDYAGPTMLAAVVMGVAVWGVYRLRTWALFLNLAANIAIAYFAMEGTLNLSPSVSLTLATTAAIQSFIPVPILAVALGDRNAGQPLLSGVRQKLMRGALYGLSFLAILGVPFASADGWVDGPGRAFVRGVKNVRGPYNRVRHRLGAQSNDLRGRSFSGKRLAGGDFEGVDLRDAKLISADLFSTSFMNADLRGADLRRANFGVGARAAVLRGAKLQGADLTGAVVVDALWDGIEPSDLTGTRCPDGTKASAEDGCEGKLGLFPAHYSRRFLRKPVPGDARCGTDEAEATASVYEEPGPLLLGGEAYVRLANGGLVSRLSTIVPRTDGQWWEQKIRWRRSTLGRETWTCESLLVPLEPDPINDPGASSPDGDLP